MTDAMVGNYAGHTLSEAYNNRNVTEKKAETATKHKATVQRAKAEVRNKKPTASSKANAWNANRDKSKAWNEL